MTATTTLDEIEATATSTVVDTISTTLATTVKYTTTYVTINVSTTVSNTAAYTTAPVVNGGFESGAAPWVILPRSVSSAVVNRGSNYYGASSSFSFSSSELFQGLHFALLLPFSNCANVTCTCSFDFLFRAYYSYNNMVPTIQVYLNRA
jgi:hypothetical protein